MFSDLRANYDCLTAGVVTSPCDLASTGATTQIVHAPTPSATSSACSSPKTATAVAGDASASITWTAPAGEVTGYTVEVTNTKTGTVFSLPRVDPSTGSSLVATGLSNGTP